MMFRLLLVMILILIPALLAGRGVGPGSSGYLDSIEISLQSGEHPEHPSDAEHPEHPAGSGHSEHAGTDSAAHEHAAETKEPVTVESVATYLEGYVTELAAEKEGWMEVQDEAADRTLKLKLDRIHRERLSKTGEGTYFVCADFKTPEGKVYDLDFWVKETDEGLAVTETTIHKEAGNPRYNWVEKDGVWNRVPVVKE